MDPTRAVIWIFLGIFVLTALIALGGLVGWVSLEPYYKKNLFKLLILEVVGCVIGFSRRMGVESLGDSDIGVLSDCVFTFMVQLNPWLGCHISARPAIPKAKSRNRDCRRFREHIHQRGGVVPQSQICPL